MATMTAARTGVLENGVTEPAWGAVYALALCTFTLIASEFMPISLLSPIAETLSLTEGQAGQSISISGVFAVVTSLFISNIAGRTDRRHVLLALATLLIVSGALVAVAPNYLVLMIGRGLVGIAVGGFWSMSAATIMRLVPERAVPKCLAILNGGGALATTLGAPLGSFLGGMIGWRGAFFVVVPIAVLSVIWQAVALPSMPIAAEHKGSTVFGLLRRPEIAAGMVAVSLLFTGQYALYTYLRPFLEQVTQVGVNTLAAMLLLRRRVCRYGVDRPLRRPTAVHNARCDARNYVGTGDRVGRAGRIDRDHRGAAHALGARRHCRTRRLVDLDRSYGAR